jgi:hypothetical protein
MKNRFFQIRTWAGALVCVPLLTACYDENAKPNQASTAAAATNASGPAVTTTPVLAPPPTNAAPPKSDPVVKKTFDPTTLNLAPGLLDIIKLAQSGVSEDVMINFAAQSPYAYKLTADEIVYLNDLGVPQNVVAAMLRKVVKEEPQVATTPPPAPPEPQPQPPPAPAPVPAPAPPVTNAPAVAVPPQPVVEQQPVQPATNVVVQQPVYVYTQPAQTVVTYQYFYDSLSPYGDWIYLADYGYCWRPTVAVVDRGWRPYCHGGGWLWTDCGWYWRSDYSWGWAPFHYGRWQLHGAHGWMWMPDLHWGPAWVSWRHSPTYYGWAPLPPGAYYHSGIGFTYWNRHVGISFDFGLGHNHFTFVPTHRFYDRQLYSHAATVQQARSIYNNTTVINNYVTGNNNTIINSGVSRDLVVKATKSEIPTVQVRDLPANTPATLRADRLEREGNKQVVYRQMLPQNATPGSTPIVTPAVANLAKTKALSVPPAVNNSSLSPGNTGAGATRFTPLTPQKPVGAASEVSPNPAAGAPRPETLSRASSPPLVNQTAPPVEPIKSPPASIGPARSSLPTTPAKATAPETVIQPRTVALTPTAAPTTPAPAAQPKTSPGPARSVTPVAPAKGSDTPPVAEPPKASSPPARSTMPNDLFNRSTAPTKSYEPRTVAPRPEPVTPKSSAPAPTYSPPATPSVPVRTITPAPATPTRSTPSPEPRSVPVTPTPKSSLAAPTVPSYTPPSPSYTPPARSTPSPVPSYTPPARSIPSPAPSYTPPARSIPSPAPSYTPPARSYSPPAAPSYSPPARSAPAPSFSPPAKSYSAPSSSPGSAGSSEGKRFSR